MNSSAPILVFPDPAPVAVAQVLDLAGIPGPGKPLRMRAAAMAAEPEDGWAGAVVMADEDPETAFSLCRSIRRKDVTVEPLLLVIKGTQLTDLGERDDLFDDFCLTPFHPVEFEARICHGLWRSGHGEVSNVVQYGDLALNIETYQAAFNGRPLDLTYMEYELLKFFVTHTHKVLFARTTPEPSVGVRVLRRRTHRRRSCAWVRAKLGEEHAGLIQTVRSVGYRFGANRWGADTAEE